MLLGSLPRTLSRGWTWALHRPTFHSFLLLKGWKKILVKMKDFFWVPEKKSRENNKSYLSTTSMALGKKAGNPLFGLDLTRHLQRLEAIFPAIFVSKILPRMKFWTYMYQIHRKKIKIFKIDLTKLFEYIPFSEPHRRRLHWNGST